MEDEDRLNNQVISYLEMVVAIGEFSQLPPFKGKPLYVNDKAVNW